MLILSSSMKGIKELTSNFGWSSAHLQDLRSDLCEIMTLKAGRVKAMGGNAGFWSAELLDVPKRQPLASPIAGWNLCKQNAVLLYSNLRSSKGAMKIRQMSDRNTMRCCWFDQPGSYAFITLVYVKLEKHGFMFPYPCFGWVTANHSLQLPDGLTQPYPILLQGETSPRFAGEGGTLGKGIPRKPRAPKISKDHLV